MDEDRVNVEAAVPCPEEQVVERITEPRQRHPNAVAHVGEAKAQALPSAPSVDFGMVDEIRVVVEVDQSIIPSPQKRRDSQRDQRNGHHATQQLVSSQNAPAHVCKLYHLPAPTSPLHIASSFSIEFVVAILPLALKRF